MKSMYVVYGENEMERRYLEGEFMEKSGLFIVPFSHLKTLHDLIDKICLEYFKKDESIFIEKLKNFIAEITNFSFSFPLWREILSELKDKSLLAERHQNYFTEMNKIFMEENNDKQIFNPDDATFDEIDEDDFGKADVSYRSLSDNDNMNEQNGNFVSLKEMEEIGNFTQNKVKQKDKESVIEFEKTNDKSIKNTIKKSNAEIQLSHNFLGESLCFIDPNSPIKQLQDFEAEINKFTQSSIQFQIPKVSRKNKLPSYIKTSEENDDFINSFKKHGSSPVAQMIIQDESFNQIVKNEKKTQKLRKKLDEELYENTKSVKSKEYNRNIKTILMNKKAKDRKKEVFEGQKSKISGVVGAYELRRATSQIFDFGEEGNSKLFKSSGKSVFNGKREKKQ